MADIVAEYRVSKDNGTLPNNYYKVVLRQGKYDAVRGGMGYTLGTYSGVREAEARILEDAKSLGATGVQLKQV